MITNFKMKRDTFNCYHDIKCVDPLTNGRTRILAEARPKDFFSIDRITLPVVYEPCTMRLVSVCSCGTSFQREHSFELLLLAFTLIGNLTKPVVHIDAVNWQRAYNAPQWKQ